MAKVLHRIKSYARRSFTYIVADILSTPNVKIKKLAGMHILSSDRQYTKAGPHKPVSHNQWDNNLQGEPRSKNRETPVMAGSTSIWTVFGELDKSAQKMILSTLSWSHRMQGCTRNCFGQLEREHDLAHQQNLNIYIDTMIHSWGFKEQIWMMRISQF